MGPPKPAATPPGAAGRALAPTQPGSELGAANDTAQPYCVIEGVQALDRQPWGTRPPPWAPGRREEINRAVSHLDDAGLLAEKIDPADGAQLRNFPQAFSHIGLVNAAWEIHQAEQQPQPTPAPSQPAGGV